MLSVKDAKEIFEEVYKGENGYLVSFYVRKKLPKPDPNLTYGEVKFESFREILKKVKPGKGEIFYDLGSGTGKAVILASLLSPFKKIVGIELLEDLIKVSERVLRRFKKIVKERFPKLVLPQIEFVQGNFLWEDFSEADVVFVHSTCFSDELMESLTNRLENLKKGSRVITVTQKLNSDSFRSFETESLDLSWGKGTVYFWEKIK